MGTKFMVFRMREIIKTALFAVLGVAMIIALIYLFAPDKKEEACMPKFAVCESIEVKRP